MEKVEKERGKREEGEEEGGLRRKVATAAKAATAVGVAAATAIIAGSCGI